MKKRVAVVGAGPGGLTAAMLLGARGFEVSVFEKEKTVGGRCGSLERNGFRWDIGPTFLMYLDILKECFAEAGADLEKELDLVRLDPMYELFYHDKRLRMSSDPKKMGDELEKHFPGSREGYLRFRKEEKEKFSYLKPVLQRDFSNWKKYLSLDLIKAVPHLGIASSLFDRLRSSFEKEDLALAFSFQSKYLGMSAWKCPSLFSIIPHLEHEYGVYHVRGGLSQISEAMGRVASKQGVEICTSKAVKEVVSLGGKASGLLFEDGSRFEADYVVLNADFAYSMKNLFKEEFLAQYTRERVEALNYSCSTFMLYLGLEGEVDLPFHSIVFAEDYKQNIRDIFEEDRLSKDMSLYVRNPNGVDKTLAPEGKTALYVLVPVPNLKQFNSWASVGESFREEVLSTLERRLGLQNLRSRIEEEIVYTPETWEKEMNVGFGATFNLSHAWDQLAMFRPQNAFEDVESVYLVGGGTHPGSGLPTIYESGRIATKLILEKEGRSYDSV